MDESYGSEDIQTADTNADGIVDAVLVDSSGDGVMDVAVVDSDYDGVADTGYVDADQDGYVDETYDLTSGGAPAYAEPQVPNPAVYEAPPVTAPVYAPAPTESFGTMPSAPPYDPNTPLDPEIQAQLDAQEAAARADMNAIREKNDSYSYGNPYQ